MQLAAKVLRIIGTLLGLKGTLFLLLGAWGAVAIPQTLLIGLTGTWLLSAALLFWAAQHCRVYGGSNASEAPTRRCILGGAIRASRQSSVHKRGRR